MCGRFAQGREPIHYIRRFGAHWLDRVIPNIPARYNAAPTQDVLVIRRNPKTARGELGVLRWGLVPNWAKDTTIAFKTINARSETVRTTAAFRDAWKAGRRCVIPVDAFYEWKPGTNPKQPYAIARQDGAPLALAGLWDGWKDPASGEWLRTFTILTCVPNPFMAQLHDRMPVILPHDGVEHWLSVPDGSEVLRPYEGEDLRMWPVSTRLNAPRNEGADLLEEVAPAAPLTLALGD